MSLNAPEVADAALAELRSNHLPAFVPLLAIRGQDPVAKNRSPILVDPFSFAVVVMLSVEDSLDVLWICRKHYAPAACVDFHRVWITQVAMFAEQPVPEQQIFVLAGIEEGLPYEVGTCSCQC